MTAALAAFVKTLGISPIKAGLARTRGKKGGEGFYALALDCIEEVLALTPGVYPFWAVAEIDGMLDSRWLKFPVINQGEGQLGDRLARVYGDLRRCFPHVTMIGADSPQLLPSQVSTAQTLLRDGAEFVLGPAAGGGFYLLAGRKDIPAEVWRAVEYGTLETSERLSKLLEPLGSVALLEAEPDIDTDDDFTVVASLLMARPDRTESQRRLLEWLQANGVEAQGQ